MSEAKELAHEGEKQPCLEKEVGWAIERRRRVRQLMTDELETVQRLLYPSDDLLLLLQARHVRKRLFDSTDRSRRRICFFSWYRQERDSSFVQIRCFSMIISDVERHWTKELVGRGDRDTCSFSFTRSLSDANVIEKNGANRCHLH